MTTKNKSETFAFVVFCAAILFSVFIYPEVIDAAELPTKALTPGVADKAVTQRNIKSTICKPGYTKTVRNVPSSMKKRVYGRYGLTGNNTGYCMVKEGCEIDHLIPLELGGNNNIENLWPQPYTGLWNAHMKDALENTLNARVCSKKMTLVIAQQVISENWETAYSKYVRK